MNSSKETGRQAARNTYLNLVARLSPKSKLTQGLLRAFWVGGLICALGQGITDIGATVLHLNATAASTLCSVTLVFLTALLTGIGNHRVEHGQVQPRIRRQPPEQRRLVLDRMRLHGEEAQGTAGAHGDPPPRGPSRCRWMAIPSARSSETIRNGILPGCRAWWRLQVSRIRRRTL